MESILKLVGEGKLLRHLAYSFKDVNFYIELTPQEKLIFSEQDFIYLKNAIDSFIHTIPQKVSLEVIHKIIEDREEKGLFYSFDDGYWIGVNNLSGDALIEASMTEERCVNWLSKKS